MNDHSEAFIDLDTSKLRNAVAIADGGRGGEVRFLGEIDAGAAATTKLVKKLAAKHQRLTFCYEAGPTGYGLYRQIKSLGYECIVVAPSLMPKKGRALGPTYTFKLGPKRIFVTSNVEIALAALKDRPGRFRRQREHP